MASTGSIKAERDRSARWSACFTRSWKGPLATLAPAGIFVTKPEAASQLPKPCRYRQSWAVRSRALPRQETAEPKIRERPCSTPCFQRSRRRPPCFLPSASRCEQLPRLGVGKGSQALVVWCPIMPYSPYIFKACRSARFTPSSCVPSEPVLYGPQGWTGQKRKRAAFRPPFRIDLSLLGWIRNPYHPYRPCHPCRRPCRQACRRQQLPSSELRRSWLRW